MPLDSRPFPEICSGDPMVNFNVPKRIGFGIARGSACCLVSGNEILDYSGHKLNLAARLMDLARPEGIVVDDSFGVQLLSNETAKLFEKKQVFVRSIAEEQAIPVHIQKGTVQLRPESLQPLVLEKWEQVTQERSVAEWRKRGAGFWRIQLPSRLKRPDGMRVRYIHPAPGAKGTDEFVTYTDHPQFEYQDIANDPIVKVDLRPMIQTLKERKLQLKTLVKLTIDYVPRTNSE